MYCNKCGSIVPDNATRCTVCGAAAQPKEGVGFVDAMKLYFARFADFSGRSRRSEYWWATLGVMIISSLVTTILPDLAWIWSLVTLVPSMAMCVRRLHDVGKSGWFYLWVLLPLIGSIIDADKHKYKRNKFLAYIFAGSIGLVVAGALCFVPLPNASAMAKNIIFVGVCQYTGHGNGRSIGL